MRRLDSYAMKGTTIAIAAQKGGVGKTTSTITIAAYLARQGKKILVIDIDAQRNATLVLLPGYETLRAEQTVAILLRDEIENVATVIHPSRVEQLHLIPAHSRLSEADVVLSQLMAREARLKLLLDKVKAHYDLILIDCPPNVNWIPINAFVAADYVLIPVSPNAFDLEGIRLTLNTMRNVQKYHNPQLQLLGILMNLFDHRNSISHEIYALLQKQFGDKLFTIKIPVNTALQKSNAHRQDIYSFEPTATGALAYQSFIEKELLPRLSVSLPSSYEPAKSTP
jgi:chromosome partitioning protein